jgi:hypothetical protein
MNGTTISLPDVYMEEIASYDSEKNAGSGQKGLILSPYLRAIKGGSFKPRSFSLRESQRGSEKGSWIPIPVDCRLEVIRMDIREAFS